MFQFLDQVFIEPYGVWNETKKMDKFFFPFHLKLISSNEGPRKKRQIKNKNK